MSHPYRDLPTRAFWRTAVTDADRTQFPGLYAPRFGIDPTTRVATAGSCFAQHIGTYLRAAGCKVLDCEKAPRGMTEKTAKRFGYGLFSARYGNVYTARQMRQLLQDAVAPDPSKDHVWPLGDRFVDAFRPTVEPEGLDSVEEVLLHRRHHLLRLGNMLKKTDVFVFTLGLTETWEDVQTGRVFPLSPGVAGGTFDPDRHRFYNQTHADVLADLAQIRDLLRQFNPAMELLLTVSPVPLTATATPEHVLSATTYSKATLRSAAGAFVAATDDVDYFPSYEIITAPASGGPWFAPNMRSVSAEGVEKVMGIFLAAHGLFDPAPPDESTPDDDPDEDDDLVCDELLLQAFAK
ncbi:GSCFA domain-containing protein [Cognatiyoonia koreensis]|nr:GSCFA domain-containing protein [Cognatiyoonia koreensis]